MQCVQGILNLAPNGPDDGGLVVLKGSHNANETFFKLHPESAGAGTWGSMDWHGFNEKEVEWFKSRGCEEIKVCAEPGGKLFCISNCRTRTNQRLTDLILWDSRQIHYNKVPSTQNVRSVMYICYTPASFASQEDLEKKADHFRNRFGTVSTPSGRCGVALIFLKTHWPHANIFHHEDKKIRLGQPDTYSRDRPAYEPEESDLVLKLAGVKAY